MAEPRVKRPSFQWYPGDFRRDVAVQACSFEARALWREMLDLMHDGEPYGHLTGGGVPIETSQLARLVGQPAARVVRWLAELESRKVFSRNAVGVIYSRRMVKDEGLREVRAAAGKKGGNPALLVKQRDIQPANQPEKQKPTPAVASAVAFAVAVSVAQEKAPTSGAENSGREVPPAAAPFAYADLPASAVHWLTTFYPKSGTKPERWRDVADQLVATLNDGALLNGSARRVLAFSPERLEAKCREVLAAPPRKADAAIVVLLKKLADTSDGAAPGQVAEAAAAEERRQDDRTRADRLDAARKWLSAQPAVAAQLEAALDNDACMPRDPNPIRNVMWESKLLA